jgi:hypothetical protein
MLLYQVVKQEESYSALGRLKSEERDRKKKIQESERQLAKLEHERDNPPNHEDLQELEAELANSVLFSSSSHNR